LQPVALDNSDYKSLFSTEDNPSDLSKLCDYKARDEDMHKKEYQLRPGNPYPSGSRAKNKGVNFSIFSRYATHVELLLF